MHNPFKLVLLIIIILNFNFLYGQDNKVSSDSSIWDLSLEDLMDINVESATKTKLSVQKAPSVVRMFTTKDFERNGYLTLQDVLNTVPGIQVQEYRAGHQLSWVRGVQARYNNKVLLLIDGVPMRDSYYGNFNLDDMLSLNNVEKIEILNGPGSVLYGANSFSGVINITTKSIGRSIRTAYGTYNKSEVTGEYSYKGLYVSGKYMHSDGFQPSLMSNGINRNIDQTKELIAGSLKYNNNDFTAQASISHYQHPYQYRSSDKDYKFIRTPITGSVSYTPQINENSSIKVLAYINRYGFERDKTKFVDDESLNIEEHSVNELNSQLIGIDLNYNFKKDRHQLVFGGSLQYDKALGMNENIDFHIDGEDEEGVVAPLTDPNVSRSFLGMYVQDVFSINDILSLTAGIRYDVLDAFDNQFNYRVGLTGQKKNMYAKLLYGTAYRVPSYREYLDVDAPNPDLKPEDLKTLEFQLGYVDNNTDVNLTFFNNSYNDFIQEIVVDSVGAGGGAFTIIDDEMAFNFSSRNISGLELNLKTTIWNGFNVNGGFSYFLNIRETLGDLNDNIYTSEPLEFEETDLTFLSKISGFVNLSYVLKDRYVISFNNLLAGSRNVPANYQAGVPIAVRNSSNSDGYIRSDLYLSSSFMSSGNVVVSFKITNLFDQSIYSPPYGGSSGYDAEWMGRQFRLGVGFRVL